MPYELCGKCLHAKSSHERTHEFMYCAVCFRLCDLDEFEVIHKPTDINTVMEIASKKTMTYYSPASYILHHCIFCKGIMITNIRHRQPFFSKIIHTDCRLLLQGKIMRVRNRATFQ